MGTFKDRRNYVDHDINTSTVLIDGEDKAEGWDSFEAEMDVDETEYQSSADGLSIAVHNPITTGTLKLVLLEPSKTSGVLWALKNSNSTFSLQLSDSSVPDLKVVAQKCRFMKAPVIKRGKDVDRVEWSFRCGYLSVAGGGYEAAV